MCCEWRAKVPVTRALPQFQVHFRLVYKEHQLILPTASTNFLPLRYPLLFVSLFKNIINITLVEITVIVCLFYCAPLAQSLVHALIIINSRRYSKDSNPTVVVNYGHWGNIPLYI